MTKELLVALSPDPDSKLGYLRRSTARRRDGVPHLRHLAAHESLMPVTRQVRCVLEITRSLGISPFSVYRLLS